MAPITESDIRQMQSLFIASMVGDLEGVVTILNHHKHDVDGNNVFGIDIDPQGWGRRPIHGAIIAGHIKIVEFYIKNGANINIQTTYGDTPLHFAIHHNRSIILKMLLEAGADPTIQNNIQKSALDIAKDQNKEDFIKEMKNYVKVEPNDENGSALKKFLQMK